MLNYTGHPIVDVGAATIAAFARKPLRSITEADLDQVADFIAKQYVVDPLKSFLNVAFPNSGFTNPAFEKTPQKRSAYAERILRAYKAGQVEPTQSCVFTGRSATTAALSEKLPPGRAFRQHIPMVTGEGVINFHPGGDAGLPVSGEALLCIQAFPLGCAKCGGKLLAVHSDNWELTEAFAALFLHFNRSALVLAQQQGSKKMPEAGASAKTLLIETLLNIEMHRREAAAEHQACSVTAYHLSNIGPSNPLDRRSSPLEIYHLPLELTEFLSLIMNPEYSKNWEVVAKKGWRVAQPSKGKKTKTGAEQEKRPRRNVLYEDLFDLPGNAREFIRSYFLRIPRRNVFEDDPRRAYSTKEEAELVSWKLAELFLRKVMNMNQDRINEIRKLGDRLANYIKSENDRRFFRSVYAEQDYRNFRNALIRANLAEVKRGNPPLVSLEPFITVFEEGDEVARTDWRLARDLVLIRMIEQLHGLGWLASNRDVIPEPSSLESQTTQH